MSQAEKLAKTARENLAAALSALQTSADVPPELLEVADIIAQCMGVLHRIERTQGADLTGKEVALASVRKALDHLQALELTHPVLDIVLEKVAGSLASVHGLSRLQAPAPAPAVAPAAAPPQPMGIPAPPAAAPAPQYPQQAYPQQAPTVPQPSAAAFQVASAPAGAVKPGNTAQMPSGVQPMHPGMSTQVLPQNAFPPPQAFPAAPVSAAPVAQQAQPAAQAYQQAPQAQAYAPMAQGVQPAPQQRAQPQPGFAQQAAPQQSVPQQGGFGQAGFVQAHAGQPQAAQQAAQQPANVAAMQAQNAAQARHETARMANPAASSPAPAAAGSESGNVVVELGTHSVSNFYKGLGGNDVIEHGGLFVATYRIPKLGTNVKLRVLLPGDLEFMATGVVQWIRDPHSGGEASEPGFGARLTQITPEGRQLVYRYTRNREPMFYDDL